MIQAIVKKGKVFPENVPAPIVSPGSLLIKVVNSCISAGTELSNISITGKSLIRRALDQPEEVRSVLNFARQNGIAKTLQRVRGQLDGGKPTGYSLAGVVVGVGEDVKGFEIGDSVGAAGAGIANHAEYVEVPLNLVMKMPPGMDYKYASTVTMGGIAMQGVRRADLRLGETCVIIGAGMLGLLTQQLLQISGVRTIVSDPDQGRLEIANKSGADLVINPLQSHLVDTVDQFTGGYGADAVIFTAATHSSEPLSQAFNLCKRKGRVVLVGVSGMEIKREDIYNKELDFLMSTSYGPGRYDRNYEEKGMDYPFAYVRWTENRNMTEYLRLVHDRKINLDLLIDAVFPIEEVENAFLKLNSQENKPISTLLDYGTSNVNEILEKFSYPRRKFNTSHHLKKVNSEVVQVALVGAGGFAKGMHLPNIKKLAGKFHLRAVMSRTGHSAAAVAQQYGAAYSTTDYDEILRDSEIDLVMICTRHESHAEIAHKALLAGKHVFVEKPLATNKKELDSIVSFYADRNTIKPLLMVGFNRRFSKYAVEIKRHTDKRINPMVIHYRMNAGFISLDHWVHDHGGRVVGEACHIIDLMTFLTGSSIKSVSSEFLTPSNEKYSSADNVSISLKYADGSICHLHYFAVGSKELSKEFMEIHFDGKSIIMDDFKKLTGYGIKVKELSSSFSEKGQFEELKILYDCLRGHKSTWPIELWDLTQTTEASFLVG